MCSRNLCVRSLLVCLIHIWHVACLAGRFIYPTSIVVWYFFWVLGFDVLLYCVLLLKAMFIFVCLQRLVTFLTCVLWYVNVVIFCLHRLFFLCELCAVFVFFVLLCVYLGSYCSALWFVLFPILFVVFLLLVGMTEFCWYDSGSLQFCVRSGGWVRSWRWCLSL